MSAALLGQWEKGTTVEQEDRQEGMTLAEGGEERRKDGQDNMPACSPMLVPILILHLALV